MIKRLRALLAIGEILKECEGLRISQVENGWKVVIHYPVDVAFNNWFENVASCKYDAVLMVHKRLRKAQAVQAVNAVYQDSIF